MGNFDPPLREGHLPPGTPAAVYARISPRPTKPGKPSPRESSISIEEQVRICRETCRRYGWRVRYVLEDRLESAKDLERPNLQKLLEHVAEQRVGVVVVWKLDRMWRTLRDTVNLFEFFTECGVAFHSCTEPFDNTSSFGRFVFRNVASAAELERELIRERTMMALHWRARQGLWIGRAPPFGYSRDDAGQLAVDTTEAKTVRLLFGLYMRLKSMEAVAERLNAQGVTSRNGQPWTSYRVHRILTNPIYGGTLEIAGIQHARPKLRVVAPQAYEQVRALRGSSEKRPPREGRDERRDDAIRSVFGQYARMLGEMERAGELAPEDPLGAALSALKEES